MAQRVFSAVMLAAILAGLVWLWVNLGFDDMTMKVIAVAVLGAAWAGIVAAVGGVIAAMLGLGATVFRR